MAKDIEPKLKLISDYLKIDKKEIFVIPQYQRGYSWGKDQCDKLWQDIENFIDSNCDDPYFFGTIIMDCSEESQLKLIDGQQRTTTFLLLLKALLIRLQEILINSKKDSDTEKLINVLSKRRDKIIEILYKADDEDCLEILADWSLVEKRNVLENKSINELYGTELATILKAKNYTIAEANVKKIPKKQKDNKYTKFFRNFKFFYEKLSDYKDIKLSTFSKAFLEKCQIIEIRSWQIEQAITMFNSLNSTGMPLSDADIISAQLYSNANDKTAFNELWEKINKLASELSARKIIDIDSILQQFMYINRAITKEYMGSGKPDVTTPGLRRYYTNDNKDILKEPMDLCNKFMKIAQIWDLVKDYPVVKLLLKFNENAKLYLISYLNRSEVKDVSEESLWPIAECLLRLFAILELVDAGYSSTNFKTFLFGENVKLVDESIPYDSIVEDFNKHIEDTWREDNIKESLLEYDKNILVYLNEYLFAKENGQAFDFKENVNVEHIMPASGHNLDAIRKNAGIATKEEFNDIVNSLGNKILLEEDINKSISNDWFQTKKLNTVESKKGYKQSKFGIAQSLADYKSDVWTKNDIFNATEKVAERILKFLFNKTEEVVDVQIS